MPRALPWLVLALGARGTGYSAIEKTISMLNEMVTKATDAGVKDTEQYTAFKGWVENFIETSKKTINEKNGVIKTQTSKRDNALSEADKAAQAVKKASEELAEAQKKKAKRDAAEDARRAQLDEDQANMAKALEAIGKAIAQLGAMKTEKLPTSFLQTSQQRSVKALNEAVESSLMKGIAATSRLQQLLKKIQEPLALLSTPEDGVIRSNKQSQFILDLLKELEVTFVTERDACSVAAKKALEAYNNLNGQLSDKIQNKKTEIIDQTNVKTTQEDLASTADGLLIQAQAILEKTEDLLAGAEDEKAKKVASYKTRLADRKDEISAINNAIDILSKEVHQQVAGHFDAARSSKDVETYEGGELDTLRDNYQVEEGKLVEGTDSDASALPVPAPISFIQMSSNTRRSDDGASTAEFLSHVSRRLNSNALMQIAEAARFDPFAKVLKMIDDLRKRLIKENAEEANKNQICNDKYHKQKTAFDTNAAAIKKTEAEIARLTSVLEQDTEQKKTNTETKEKNEEELKSATDLRRTDNVANEQCLADTRDALVGLEKAITVLTDYYARVQAPGREVAGMTESQDVSRQDSDKADIDTGDYTGQDPSAVMNLLRTVKDDTAKLRKETASAEAKDAAAFSKLKNSLEASIHKLATSIQGLRLNIRANNGYKEDAESDLTSLQNKKSQLEDLKAAIDLDCQAPGGKFEDRKAAREVEIQGLTDALEKLKERNAVAADRAASRGTFTEEEMDAAKEDRLQNEA